MLGARVKWDRRDQIKKHEKRGHNNPNHMKIRGQEDQNPTTIGVKILILRKWGTK